MTTIHFSPVRRLLRWLVCGALLAPTMLIATPYPAYHAQYQILSLDSQRPVGIYRVSLRHLSEQHAYRMDSEIRLDYRRLLRTVRYRYTDQVLYDKEGEISFEIHEEGGDHPPRTLRGRREGSGTVASLLIESTDATTGEVQTQRHARSDYDYTLFALRFPRPCRLLVGKLGPVRLLAPAEGKVYRVRSEFLDSPPRVSGGCVISTHSDKKELNKRSWLNQDGYLLHEESPVYILKLDERASNLPPLPPEPGE